MMLEFVQSLLFGGIIALAFVSSYYMYRIGFGLYQVFYAKKIHACTTCPPPDDAIESSREVMCFFYNRCREMKLDMSEQELKRALINAEKKLEDFCRLCHALGCEVVFQKVSNEDIGENTSDLKAFQDEADLRQKKFYGVEPDSYKRKGRIIRRRVPISMGAGYISRSQI